MTPITDKIKRSTAPPAESVEDAKVLELACRNLLAGKVDALEQIRSLIAHKDV